MKFENTSYIVALTPLVAYELDKAGIQYSILENHYDDTTFLKEKEAYFNDQLAWFGKFDNFLFDIFPESKTENLKLATSHYFYLKSMVDSIILRCKIIDIFINKVKPDSIVYVSRSWKEDLIGSAEYPLLFRKSQSLFSRLMPMFSEKYNIGFHRIILRQATNSKSIHHEYINFLSRIKNGFMGSKYVKNLWQYYKTFSISDIFPKSFKYHKFNVLFLKTPGFVKDIMKDAQKEGYGVYYKRGDEIIKQSFPYHKVMGRIYSNISLAPKYDINNFPKEIETNILGWINDYCGINVSSILLPRLDYFINNFCPQLLSLIDKYIEFYNDNQIDIVFTPHLVSVDEYSAIIATKYSGETKSACLQHGDSAFASTMYDIGEFLPFYLYFATNDEMEEYIKHRIKLRNFNITVFQYPNRYKILQKLNKPKKKQNNHLAPKTLVYVPKMYHWDNTFWCESRVPDTWYFSWQKELINFFSSMEDFNFIWKAIPASNEIYDPIPTLINDRGYKNIKYATEPFAKWIKKTDLVLLDYPSTALYEAAVSGLPVMSLYYAPFNVVRESAIKLFGRSLQAFSSFTEGIAKVDDFLNSCPDEFIVTIPFSKTSVVETLDRILSKSPLSTGIAST